MSLPRDVDMKISYDREVDVLTLEISDGDIDHAEEAGPMLIHLTEDNRPVLIEILDASVFLASLTKISARAAQQRGSGNRIVSTAERAPA